MSNLTKEQYNEFQISWKKAANAPQAKSKRAVCDHMQGTKDAFTDLEQKQFTAMGYTDVWTYGYSISDGVLKKIKGWLQSEHFLFRNLVLGKDPKSGFSPITTPHKLEAGGVDMWDGFETAKANLRFIIRYLKKYDLEKMDGSCQAWIEEGRKSLITRTPVRTKEEYYAKLDELLQVVEDFLLPFGGLGNYEMHDYLLSIDVD